MVGAGTEFRLTGNTKLVFGFRRFNAKYDEKESFLGEQLARALNRREDRSLLQLHYAITPLIGVQAGYHYTDINSDLLAREYSRNRVSAGVSLTF